VGKAEQAAFVAAQAKLKTEKVQSLIVAVRGRTTKIDWDEAPSDPEERRTVKWLVDAAEHGSLDPSIAAAIKVVLSDWDFTMNLSVNGLWEPLQKGVREVLKRIGTTRMAPLFIDHAPTRRVRFSSDSSATRICTLPQLPPESNRANDW